MSPGMKLWMTSILPLSSPCNTLCRCKRKVAVISNVGSLTSVQTQAQLQVKGVGWFSKAPALAVRVNPDVLQILCSISSKLFQQVSLSGHHCLSVQSLGWPQGTSLGWVRQPQQCPSWGVLGAEWRGSVCLCVCLLPPRVRHNSPASRSAKSTFPATLVKGSVDTGGQAQLQRSPLHSTPATVGVGVKHWLNCRQQPREQVAEQCLKISFFPLLLLPLDEGPYKQKWQK